MLLQNSWNDGQVLVSSSYLTEFCTKNIKVVCEIVILSQNPRRGGGTYLFCGFLVEFAHLLWNVVCDSFLWILMYIFISFPSLTTALASHDYILKIVPTVYEDMSGKQRYSYQYTVANKVKKQVALRDAPYCSPVDAWRIFSHNSSSLLLLCSAAVYICL